MPLGKKSQGRDFLIFLVFLFVSSCMWLMKVAGENLEAEISIGVIVKNLPQELQLEDDAELQVVVKADGADIIAYMMGKSRNMVVDYNDMEYRDGVLLLSTSQLVNNVASVLPGPFSFRYFKENTLVLETRQQTVELPVMLSSAYVAADGIELGDVEFTPETVAVTAPETLLQKMSYVQFGGDSLIIIGRDTVITWSLEPAAFVKYEPVAITAKVKTEPYVNISLPRRVQIDDDSLRAAESACLMPVPVTVTCKVPKSMVSELCDEHLKVNVVSRSSAADGRDTLRFGVSALPFFVKDERVTVEPELIVLD